MIENGFAKPYEKCFCKKLPEYQELNLIARTQKKGLYLLSEFF